MNEVSEFIQLDAANNNVSLINNLFSIQFNATEAYLNKATGLFTKYDTVISVLLLIMQRRLCLFYDCHSPFVFIIVHSVRH